MVGSTGSYSSCLGDPHLEKKMLQKKIKYGRGEEKMILNNNRVSLSLSGGLFDSTKFASLEFYRFASLNCLLVEVTSLVP